MRAAKSDKNYTELINDVKALTPLLIH